MKSLLEHFLITLKAEALSLKQKKVRPKGKVESSPDIAYTIRRREQYAQR